MNNPMSLFAGRKFLGPLDKAVISSYKSKINFLRTVALQEHIEELNEIEEKLKDDSLTTVERLMMESVLQVKEALFYDFLGVPYDRTNENDKLPKT